MTASPLPHEFYDRPVVQVAQDLIGCVVSYGGCSGVIVETEAYHQSEPACHAFTGFSTRTRTLFGPPGLAYVYLSYGIHEPLNAVCEGEGVAAAVLVRALEPLAGVRKMALRRGLGAAKDAGSLSVRELRSLCSGPGKLTQALGITRAHDGCDLAVGPVVIRPREGDWLAPVTRAGPRVGISKAVDLQWRFSAVGSAHLSRPA